MDNVFIYSKQMISTKIIQNLLYLPTMQQMKHIFLISIWVLSSIFYSCSSQEIKVGAERTGVYLPLLEGKSVGIVVNQTSTIKHTHLVDSLLSLGVTIKGIFGPEHGFRGNADAGEKVTNNRDTKTGIPIISLYGKNKKPTAEQLKGIDMIIFDIQDVGVRFYTYISTMHYIMEACAENGIPLIILDRPNPNGDYTAGPILELEYRSFVGMHPIPVVHGLTVGELANMINGEGWLEKSIKCDLTVVTIENWTHSTTYQLPIKPSPNLPNHQSIRLYPSLCFFEATTISIGRGTYFPFQVIGDTIARDSSFSFTPTSIIGMSKYPKFENKTCYGSDLRKVIPPHFSLDYLIKYLTLPHTSINRPDFFNLLAGNKTLLEQIKTGKTATEIKASWQTDLNAYNTMREKYLLYKLN